MNKITTVKSGEPIGPLGPTEKNKQWQRELLMERLRSHSSQHKTFQELSRAMRMSMLEKRYALDAVEKANLQKCLDSMQHCIKVTTRQGLVERLESLSRQLGLKFMEDTSGLFISSDMFYLEIILDSDGTLSDVKVHHECKIEQQSCSELVTCLLNGDFADFTVQLEGLSSIYQLNAEPKVKSKAFVALQAMETDLYNLFTMQNFHKDTQALLIDSSVGIVQKRRGGHSMKLIYFVPPYDLLNLEMKTMQPLTLDLLTMKNIGMSVSVNLEASSANKLQISPTVTFNKDMQGESVPIYSPMNAANSALLPATFVLRLNTPLPICKSLMSTLTHLNDNNSSVNDTKLVSIMDLIVQTASEGQIKNCSKGLPVNLPDQNHLYYFTENTSMKGSVVTSIPFTEPSQVSKILTILRKQALFHILLASCVRPLSKMCDIESTTMLEVTAISITQISVALEHPLEESMAYVDFDLSDGKNITCSINSLSNSYDAIAMRLSKIVQKSLSIPITVRALLKFWEQERMKGYRGMENGNFNLSLGPNDPGGRNGGGGSDFRDIKNKTERCSTGGVSGAGGIVGNGNFGGSGGRQFFHSSSGVGVMNSTVNDSFNSTGNNLSLFDTSSDINNRLSNQFGMKNNHDMSSFQDQMMGSSISVAGFSTGEDFYKNPKSNSNKAESTFCNNFSSDMSGDSSSLGTTSTTSTSDSGVTTTQSFQKVFDKSVGGSNQTIPSDNKSGGRKDTDSTKHSSLSDLKANGSSGSNTNTSVMSTSELTSVLTGMGLEKRPGIEIVPISSSTNQNFQTSITITPINVSSSSSKSSKKHGGSSSTKKSDDKVKNEKKRKRKKDDVGVGGQMGPPPEKLVSKSDSINRNINALHSVSTMKKDHSSVSPNRKHSSNLATSILNSSSSSVTSTKGNLKNSPAYSGIKNHPGASPKHSSLSGSSGKPSMLALKSVTNPMTSSKGDKSILKSQSSLLSKDKDRERDKERITGKGSSGTSPKVKSSAVKLKHIDLSAAFLQHLESSSSNEDDSKLLSNYLSATGDVISQTALSNAVTAMATSLAAVQSKMKKGSLSAVIDKLKLAQNSDEGSLGDSLSELLSETMVDKLQHSGILNSSYKVSGSQNAGSSTSLSSEYMIKPSLDGMKITINKTRTKDTSPSHKASINSSLKFPLPSGSGSPKKHTGLKPGVSSGPASKKALMASLLKSTSPASSGGGSQTTKSSFQRTNSSGSLTSGKGGGLNMSELYRKEKSTKSNKSSLGGGGDNKQVTSRPDPLDVMKILRLSSPNSSMDGFMKSLNTKFQIPKLSARTNDDSKKETTTTTTAAAVTQSTSATTVTSSTVPVTSTTSTVPVSVTSAASGVSSNTASDTSATKLFLNENVSKDLSSVKIQQQNPISKSSSTSEIKSNQQHSNTVHNTANLSGNKLNFFSSVSPKYGLHENNTFHKDLSSQLSKSSSSDAILNTFHQKDYVIKPHSSSTPSTPMHVQSPFTSPVGVTLMNSSPAYRPSPSASPNVQNVNSNGSSSCSSSNNNNNTGNVLSNDNLTMRPPSAPCTVDMTKVGSENDFGIKSSENKFTAIPTAITTAVSATAAATTTTTALVCIDQRSAAINTTAVSSSVPPPSSSLSSSTLTSLASASQSSTLSSSFTKKSNVTTTPTAITPQSQQQSQHSTVTTLNKIPVPSPSSSVSIHIVKSPVPSPLMLLPSPHSNSPCITDEEMIDESLVGIKGK